MLFVRWAPSGNPEKTMESQLVRDIRSHPDVTYVGWVEGAPEDPHASGFGSLRSQ